MAKTKEKAIRKALPKTSSATCFGELGALDSLAENGTRTKSEPKNSIRKSKRHKPSEIQFLKRNNWNCLDIQPNNMCMNAKVVLDKIPCIPIIEHVHHNATG